MLSFYGMSAASAELSEEELVMKVLECVEKYQICADNAAAYPFLNGLKKLKEMGHKEYQGENIDELIQVLDKYFELLNS